ncbi:MAG: RAMP superfamily CRISPR-associated protein [Leptolyngbyaceae cyanobacterium bins.59]|nr:RAMP superfamily CRISPR-associated protein [Leptolyngbyaceae cyanobacterium bins.59]
MYEKAYGVIETLAPLHVGASAGEETGNLNLIFRDQFTQTGIIPGSSIRGRFRANMRSKRQQWLEKELAAKEVEIPDLTQHEIVEILADGKEQKLSRLQWLEKRATEQSLKVPQTLNENHWYGNSADEGDTTEALVKFEYASLVWLPVFCPGQPVVWISCPRLLKRYQKIANRSAKVPAPYTASKSLVGRKSETGKIVLFFNLGFLEIEHEVETETLEAWVPPGTSLNPVDLVVVGDNDISMVHDMALYRQSRVKLADTEKRVAGGAFFNVEALPEGSILAFPIALKDPTWQTVCGQKLKEFYFGGLESIGFGHCAVTVSPLAVE